MNILILDNYDSFTFNLVHYVRELTDAPLDVCRNDKISLEKAQTYSHILLSPGPGLPAEAGIMPDLIRSCKETTSIFGVCLGMQAIGEVFGGTLHNLTRVYHGLARTLRITDREDITFRGIPDGIQTGRYHSWVVQPENLPESLCITAVDEDGHIMALRHRERNIRGVQFHPESVLTEYGKIMLENWINYKP